MTIPGIPFDVLNGNTCYTIWCSQQQNLLYHLMFSIAIPVIPFDVLNSKTCYTIWILLNPFIVVFTDNTWLDTLYVLCIFKSLI